MRPRWPPRCAAWRPAPRTSPRRWPRSWPRCATGATPPCAEYTRRFDTRGAAPGPLRVAPEDLAAALAALDPAVRNGLELAIANVDTVARAGLGEDIEVALPQGQTVLVRELPVERAAVYVPGGRAPYPSTVVMGAVTARAAGVREVAVCAPPGEDGDVHPVILAACALCGVDEVYRMGGAQAVAALALGTETVPAVDVLVGPGNLYVQEAKRQLSDRVGIDGFAGPSELLVVLAGDGARPARPATLDLLAQAEHGPGVAGRGRAPPTADVLRALAEDLEALAPRGRPPWPPRPCVVQAPDLDAALAFAQALAPEHLQLVGAERRGRSRRRHARRLRVRGPRGGHRLRRLRRGLQPRPAHRRRGALRLARSGRATSGAASRGAHAARRRRQLAARRRGGRPRRGLRRPRRVDGGARRGRMATPMSPHRRDRPATPRRPSCRLRVALDGTGAGERATGVGFFDHMLDLLARHGRLDLERAGRGRPRDRRATTRSRTPGIGLGQALDQALGDRAGIARYGHAIVPMDEARATCAIDISGRPLLVWSGRPAARVRSPASTTSWPRSSSAPSRRRPS